MWMKINWSNENKCFFFFLPLLCNVVVNKHHISPGTHGLTVKYGELHAVGKLFFSRDKSARQS